MLEPLKDFLSPDQIRSDEEAISIYAKDWTTYYPPKAEAILFPQTTEEVQKIVRWAIQHKVSLVPSGGRTGLSAAAMATNNECVVSFEKMNKISDFNTVDRTVRCESGVITESLQNFVQDKGYYFPVDFASRGSSQIGGNIATNAGGIKVIRYGLIRDWVAGLTVVTGGGEILRLNNGLVKNAAGYDLRQLFIGSEGTLGFICEAEMKFTKPVTDIDVLFMSVPKLADVMKVYSRFIDEGNVQAFEFMSDKALKLVVDQTSLQRPFDSHADYYLLIEVDKNNNQENEKTLENFEYCLEQGWVTDGVLSQSAQQSKDIWRLREDISECASAHSPYRNDISVRVSKIPEFLQEIDATLAQQYPDFEVIWFGHIGDGNLHLDILKPAAMKNEEFLEKCRRVDELVFQSVEKFEGSISAEHGVGLTKKPHLHHTRSPEEIEYFRQLKKTFDPHSLLNPGKVFDL